MESINERVHKLIEENRDKFNGEHVSFDGVVDEDAYLKSDVHVAFLLKDTDLKEDEKSVDWEYMRDLRKHILDTTESLYKTWPNACLWLEVLKNPETSF